MKEIIDRLFFIKMKNICSAKDNIKRMRRQATDRKYMEEMHVIKVCFKIYKELLKLNKKTT